MKTVRVLLFSVLSVFTCLGNCFATFTYQYNSYITYSADANNVIYQTVLLQGAATGDCYYPCNCGQYGCQQCPIPGCVGAQHTPSITNTIDSAGGTTTGGSGDMFNYINMQTTTSFQAQPDVDYTGTADAEVFCSAAGSSIFGSLLNIDLAVATTKDKTTNSNPQPDGSSICDVTPWCTAATSPPACNPSYVIQRPFYHGQQVSCASYYTTTWLAEKYATDVYWNCFPILPGQNASPTLDPSLGVCKKQ
jgi:hypothetical protein